MFLLAVVALLSTTALAGPKIEVGTKYTYTDNLLSDSNSTPDASITNNASVSFNPSPFIEFNLNGLHKAHRDTPRYDNRLGGLGITIVTTEDEGPLQVLHKIVFNGNRYGEGLQDFNSNTFSVRTAAGYWVCDMVRVRLGFFYQNNAFLANDFLDKASYEVYSGFNVSLPGANALDIEFGYADAKYTYISPDDLQFPPNNPYIIDPQRKLFTFSEGHLESFYISPRISRPIGPRTGVSLTFTYKEFPDLEEGVVWGASSDVLSPWAEVWQGRSVSFSLKTYLVPHLIISGGVDYYSKSYLKIHDDIEQVVYYLDVGRKDEQTKINLSIQKPITAFLGFSGEPNLSIDWVNNTSSKPLYDYSGLTVNVGFKLRR